MGGMDGWDRKRGRNHSPNSEVFLYFIPSMQPTPPNSSSSLAHPPIPHPPIPSSQNTKRIPSQPHLLYPNHPGSSHSCSLGLCLPLIRNGRGDQGRADRCCCERGGSVCRRQKGRCGQRAAERRRHLNHRNRRGHVSPWGLRFMLKRTDIHFPSS